jgi:seryl-tRNA synthetase
MLRDDIERLRDGIAPARRVRTPSSRSSREANNSTVSGAPLIQAADERKAQRNASTQEVARRKRAGEPADDLIAHGRALGEEIGAAGTRAWRRGGRAAACVARDPQRPRSDAVPAGGEEQNVIVREWGTPRPRDSVKPHWEIGAQLGMIDLERAGKGLRFGLRVLPRRRHAARARAAQLLHGSAPRRARVRGDLAAAARQSRHDDWHGQLPKFEDDAYAHSRR